MLLDLIEANTAVVSDFKVRDEEAQKSSEQHNIDANFTNAINGVKQTIVHLCGVREGADFEETQEVSKKIAEMLETCKTVIGQRYVKAADTAKINGMNRDINGALVDEWKAYHAGKTSSIKEILSIARNLSGSEATLLITDINAAANWSASVNDVIRMTEALDEANELIGKLELNDAIVEFLKKMIDHRASLEDLTSEVLEWVEKESLKKRIKLTFGQ